jgi:hypothetical protein
MPRIKLAYWHGDHKPGDEIDVSDEEFAALQRDGRVAEVVQAPAEEPPVPQQEDEAQPEDSPSAARKRR